jgi:hypothetical protein
MNRRTFVEAVAGTATIGVSAGCTGDGDGGSDGDASSPGDGTTTAPQETDTLSEPVDGGTTESPGSPPPAGEQSGRMNGVDYLFQVTDVSCGDSGNDADVAFDEDANEVVVTGTIAGSDLCRTAGLASVTYDEGEDRSAVVVETRRRAGADACGQCIAEIEYDLRLTYDAVPSEISVTHDGHSGRVGVTTAAHGSASATPPK